MSGHSLPEPDFLLIRARDLKSVLVMLDAGSHWLTRSERARAAHCFHIATGQLLGLSHSSMSLGDFLVSSGQPAPGGPACGVSAVAGAPSAFPDGNNGEINNPASLRGFL